MAKKLKLKTHRGAAKRFKITATGKVMRMHSGKRHLLGTKKANRMRRLKKMKRKGTAPYAIVEAAAAPTIDVELMPLPPAGTVRLEEPVGSAQ